ncbi:MAG: hypothetical protein N3B13_06830, partial [Deltaproteobacteria bacterium]|nr:hypothetical protein [Deltaproteobacteria bacterium]
MKKIIAVTAGVITVTVLLIFLYSKYYIPFECINPENKECPERAAESANLNVLRRVCSRTGEERC